MSATLTQFRDARPLGRSRSADTRQSHFPTWDDPYMASFSSGEIRKLSAARAESFFLDPSNLARVELGEREALAAKVLQRCADKIEFLVVDDEEAVVV